MGEPDARSPSTKSGCVVVILPAVVGWGSLLGAIVIDIATDWTSSLPLASLFIVLYLAVAIGAPVGAVIVTVRNAGARRWLPLILNFSTFLPAAMIWFFLYVDFVISFWAGGS